MRELSSLREGWEAAEEARWESLRALTVQQSAAIWLGLQQAFEAQLQETAPLFAEARRQALIELQERLQKLAQWQARNAQSVPFDPEDTTDP